MAIFERGSNEIYFMNPANGKLNSNTLKVQPEPIIIQSMKIKKESNNFKIEKGQVEIPRSTFVIDILYIPNFSGDQLLIVSSNDCYVRGYRY